MNIAKPGRDIFTVFCESHHRSHPVVPRLDQVDLLDVVLPRDKDAQSGVMLLVVTFDLVEIHLEPVAAIPSQNVLACHYISVAVDKARNIHNVLGNRRDGPSLT